LRPLEIGCLDGRYLALVYKIICQFPHDPGKVQEKTWGQKLATLFQEIANAGGLGIRDPETWRQEIRKDRFLPFGEA
jgi:hypothetical protein